MLDQRHITTAVRHLKRGDPVLGEVIGRVGPFALRPQRGRFRTLVRSIVSQQISTSAARSIFARLRARVAPRGVTPASILALGASGLREAGLSAQKTSYILDLAAKAQDKTIRFDRFTRMTDEEIIAELTQVRGIGRWTVQMLLIFSLGRPDVLPADDFGIRNSIRQLYGFDQLPTRRECETVARPWRPYASIASWYCWRSLEPPAGE